jgi:hypothetical protein
LISFRCAEALWAFEGERGPPARRAVDDLDHLQMGSTRGDARKLTLPFRRAILSQVAGRHLRA